MRVLSANLTALPKEQRSFNNRIWTETEKHNAIRFWRGQYGHFNLELYYAFLDAKFNREEQKV